MNQNPKSEGSLNKNLESEGYKKPKPKSEGSLKQNLEGEGNKNQNQKVSAV